jgi:hypothetical protein
VLATLERAVGRDGFHYSVSLGHDGGLGAATAIPPLTDLDDLGDAA